MYGTRMNFHIAILHSLQLRIFAFALKFGQDACTAPVLHPASCDPGGNADFIGDGQGYSAQTTKGQMFAVAKQACLLH